MPGDKRTGLRFLLSGYYGFGNLGDEALLEIIVTRLQERYPRGEIEVLSADPPVTEQALRIAASPRADPANIRRAIERCDVVLSGGGGLLQNATSLRSLLYYAGIIRSAVKAQRKTMIFAQSIGPLDFVGRQTVREFCRGISAATVRDERSRALLGPLLPNVEVERTADPVFLYRGDGDDDERALAGIGDDGRPLVLVSVRLMPKFAEVAARVAEAVDLVSARHGARVAFVSFSEPSDADASTQVIAKCKTRPMLLPVSGLRDMAALVRRARLLIGIRLHSLILAARFGVPFIAVPYDPKVSGLCEDLGYSVPPLWPAQGPLGPLIDDVWERHGELSNALAAETTRLQARALRNFEVLDRLIA